MSPWEEHPRKYCALKVAQLTLAKRSIIEARVVPLQGTGFWAGLSQGAASLCPWADELSAFSATEEDRQLRALSYSTENSEEPVQAIKAPYFQLLAKMFRNLRKVNNR